MDQDTHPRDAAAVIAVAKEAAERKLTLQAVDPDEAYVTLDRDGNARILDLERLRDQPDRAKGTYEPATVESFVDYVAKHQEKEHTTIWVHSTKGEVLAILDDHAAKATAWREHRAKLTLERSTEWDFWLEKDNSLMTQTDFADHLEEGLPDIVEPDGATLLEIAEKFHATTAVKFRSGVDRTSGEVKFMYDESIEASAETANGKIAVPRSFTLMLAPFIGEEKVVVTARLRHKAQGGTLFLGYKLERPERVTEEALEGIAERLDDKFTRVYRGTPA